jgi:hypothetical protein
MAQDKDAPKAPQQGQQGTPGQTPGQQQADKDKQAQQRQGEQHQQAQQKADQNAAKQAAGQTGEKKGDNAGVSDAPRVQTLTGAFTPTGDAEKDQAEIERLTRGRAPVGESEAAKQAAQERHDRLAQITAAGELPHQQDWPKTPGGAAPNRQWYEDQGLPVPQ